MNRSAAFVIGIALCLLSVVGSPSHAQERAPGRGAKATEKKVDSVDLTVYITKTGAKYHRDSCRHLSRSKIPVSLKEAATNYGPCSVCKPPAPAAAVESTVTVPARTAPSRVASSTRCQATTKAGAQCKRNAQAGRSYCWQHGA